MGIRQWIFQGIIFSPLSRTKTESIPSKNTKLRIRTDTKRQKPQPGDRKLMQQTEKEHERSEVSKQEDLIHTRKLKIRDMEASKTGDE